MLKKVVESVVQQMIDSVEILRELGVTKHELLNAVAHSYSESNKLLQSLGKLYLENPEAKDWTPNERFGRILGLESTIFRPARKRYFCELLGDDDIKLNFETSNTVDSSFDRFYMFGDVEKFEFFRSVEDARRVCFAERSEEE